MPANSFAFLGSYNIFMARLCAVMITHYVAGTTGNIHVPSLYNGSKSGLYYYASGVNWIAVLAWISGVAMGIPELVGTFRPEAVSEAAILMYNMGWLLTFATSATVHSVVTRFWMPRAFPSGFEGIPVAWEYLASGDGFFEGEKESTGNSPESGSAVDIEIETKGAEKRMMPRSI